MIDDVLGVRLRQLREARGMKPGQLATRSGVTRDHIYKIEHGIRRNVGPETVVRLAEALDTTPDYLLGQTDDYSRPDSDGPPVIMPDPDVARLVPLLNALPPPVRSDVLGAIGRLLLAWLQFVENARGNNTETGVDPTTAAADANTDTGSAERDLAAYRLGKAGLSREQREQLFDIVNGESTSRRPQ